MKKTYKILAVLVTLICISAVPDNYTFSFSDVKNELESNGGGTIEGLVEAFAEAKPYGFDSRYSGSKDRLTNFRNYSNDPPFESGEVVVASAWDDYLRVNESFGIGNFDAYTPLPGSPSTTFELYSCWIDPLAFISYSVNNDGNNSYSIYRGTTTRDNIPPMSQVALGGQPILEWYGLTGNFDYLYSTEQGGVTGRVWRADLNGTTIGFWSQFTVTTGDWYGIAASLDSRFVTAIAKNNGIYTYDYNVGGNAMIFQLGISDGRDVAMSTNGKYQTAVYNDGKIYRSSDYGDTWSFVVDYGTSLYSVDLSGDGRYQYAVGDDKAYRSTNYGVTWTLQTGIIDADWKGVACNYVGNIVYLVAKSKQIYKSTNYMANAIANPSTSTRDWKDISTNKVTAVNPVAETLSLNSKSISSITVTWSNLSDDVVSTYRLYIRQQGSSWGSYSTVYGDDSNSYSFFGLSSGTTYDMKIVTVDAFNNKSLNSNILTTTTP